ncbi:MAG TPA: histidine triad nucleotide-binding protein [Oligoflexia bacterium]|nr:histidine triad nucleotide-binding protein [Oligoflexia bacterium]HMP27472.1 histidine triad nucleotide-binding protein [Oligoflexia bacterium]
MDNIKTETTFSKIIRKEIPADIVYEDEDFLAFKDIAPQAPVHIVVITKKHIINLADANSDDAILLGGLLLKIAEIARGLKLEEKGYRVVTNIGPEGGQSVYHLHFHLLGGKQMAWPPG